MAQKVALRGRFDAVAATLFGAVWRLIGRLGEFLAQGPLKGH